MFRKRVRIIHHRLDLIKRQLVLNQLRLVICSFNIDNKVDMAFFELVFVDVRCTPAGRKGTGANSRCGGDVKIFDYVAEFVGEGGFVGDNLFS